MATASMTEHTARFLVASEAKVKFRKQWERDEKRHVDASRSWARVEGGGSGAQARSGGLASQEASLPLSEFVRICLGVPQTILVARHSRLTILRHNGPTEQPHATLLGRVERACERPLAEVRGAGGAFAKQ